MATKCSVPELEVAAAVVEQQVFKVKTGKLFSPRLLGCNRPAQNAAGVQGRKKNYCCRLRVVRVDTRGRKKLLGNEKCVAESEMKMQKMKVCAVIEVKLLVLLLVLLENAYWKTFLDCSR